MQTADFVALNDAIRATNDNGLLVILRAPIGSEFFSAVRLTYAKAELHRRGFDTVGF
jgi:hypothetical protein